MQNRGFAGARLTRNSLPFTHEADSAIAIGGDGPHHTATRSGSLAAAAAAASRRVATSIALASPSS